MLRYNKGFTLIELMIVIAMIAIMAAILLPLIFSATKTGATFGANGMTETRCIEGYKFVVGQSGTVSQMMDGQGNGIPCQ